MDLSSMALLTKLDCRLSDHYDQKTLKGITIIDDQMVVSFLNSEMWRETSWEEYYKQAAEIRRRFFEVMQQAAHDIVERAMQHAAELTVESTVNKKV